MIIIKEKKNLKKMSEPRNRTNGVGILTVMLIVFIILKLTGNINWSWFWVLSPWLIPLIVVGIIVVAWFIVLLIEKLADRW